MVDENPMQMNNASVHETASIERLIFVYKANSGLLNAIIDSARKVLMVNGCALCEITHGLAGEKREWRACEAELGVPIDYLHLDELDHDLQTFLGANLPAVVAQVRGERKLLMGPDVLSRCGGSVNDFRTRLNFHAALHGLELPLP